MKLLFMVGLFLGLAGSMLNLLVACVVDWFAAVRGCPSSQDEDESIRTRAIPFGPAIAAATVFIVWRGLPSLTWYAGLF